MKRDGQMILYEESQYGYSQLVYGRTLVSSGREQASP